LVPRSRCTLIEKENFLLQLPFDPLFNSRILGYATIPAGYDQLSDCEITDLGQEGLLINHQTSTYRDKILTCTWFSLGNLAVTANLKPERLGLLNTRSTVFQGLGQNPKLKRDIHKVLSVVGS